MLFHVWTDVISGHHVCLDFNMNVMLKTENTKICPHD